MKSMVKEAIILIAMIILAVLVMGITFYDYIPTYKTVPEVQKYIPDSKITTALDEIEEEEVESILVKPLTIDSSKLDVYQAKKSYEKGKSNPFSDYSQLNGGSLVSSSDGSWTTSAESNKGSSNLNQNSNSNSSSNKENDSKNNTNTNTSNGSTSGSGGKFFNTSGTK